VARERDSWERAYNAACDGEAQDPGHEPDWCHGHRHPRCENCGADIHGVTYELIERITEHYCSIQCLSEQRDDWRELVWCIEDLSAARSATRAGGSCTERRSRGVQEASRTAGSSLTPDPVAADLIAEDIEW
jgi:hypothetical protein